MRGRRSGENMSHDRLRTSRGEGTTTPPARLCCMCLRMPLPSAKARVRHPGCLIAPPRSRPPASALLCPARAACTFVQRWCLKAGSRWTSAVCQSWPVGPPRRTLHALRSSQTLVFGSCCTKKWAYPRCINKGRRSLHRIPLPFLMPAYRVGGWLLYRAEVPWSREGKPVRC